ncbi:putative F-box/FBD/LRR-repeat protein At5g22670 [Brassica rapa]|uniref:F-box domain-containing protein n=1 Tax=Brassica campestris TaxID=3711 RepID=M4CQZ0_BRACM|nr:putative F-box/FBD/LRR-repeat protein At5g22670 [Brassica rapa]XP_033143797.1 putative F-box/FBD/LRR-repeat protein At5g22670 [Brassica rapa]
MSERGVACRRRTGEDMISLLPDHLLCQILSDVPTKTAVVTSVLSTRWRTIWLSTPVLDLHTDDFPNFTAFASFISWFLDFSKGSSCLHKLKLDLVSKRPIQEIFIESSWDLAFVRGYLDPYYLITDWINKAVTRKVQHLDISYPWIVEMMPLSIYTCETLVSLKLQNVPLADSQYVSLPLLNTMHLVDNIYASDALLENLVSSCPVLEDLTVVRKGDTVYNFEVLRVRSQSLKSLVVVLSGRKWWYKACRVAVIDAPGLNYLSLKDNKFTSYVISSLSSSAKVDIDVSFDVEISGQTTLIDSSKRSAVRSFFSMLSSVRDMTISLTTLECICLYLKHEPLPQFPYLIRLHAVLSNSDLGNLPNILESCPNLKSLVLELNNFRKEELLIFSSSAPECLRLSLECVEIRTPIRGAVAEIELVKYFLENSAVLKKIKMRLRRGIMNNESNICMQLLRLRRCSPSCEVVVEELEDTFQGLDFFSELMNGCVFKDL